MNEERTEELLGPEEKEDSSDKTVALTEEAPVETVKLEETPNNDGEKTESEENKISLELTQTPHVDKEITNEETDNSVKPLVEEEKPKKKKSKKTLFIIIGVVLALLIIGGGVYGYFYYQDSEYNKQIALGNQYLDEEKFADAVIAFNDAIKISDKKVEGFEGLAKADTYTGDVKGASEAYSKAFDITDDQAYKNLADSVYYGNSNGNVVNGGNVVEQVDTSYILENGVTQANIWKEKDGNQENIKTVDIGDKPVENLNIQGRNLYYLNNGVLYAYNLDSGEEKSYEITDILEYLIYSDRIYFLTENALISTALDGSDRKDVITFDQTSFKFIYQDGTIYLATTDSDRETSKLYSISTDSPELVELYSSDSGVITGLVYKDYKILFKITSSTDTANEALYQLDPSTKEVIELIQPGVVSSINVDEENLFYIADKNLYKADLDGKNETLISEIPEQQTTDYYSYKVNSINVTSDNIYVINSVSEDKYSAVGYKNEIMTALLDNLSQLDSIVLSGNTEELVDPEPPFPAAYDEILAQYRIANNGGTPSNTDIARQTEQFSGMKFGYTLVDLNYDGVEELIIGRTSDSKIASIYTLQSGNAVTVIQLGAEGRVLYLTSDNLIRLDDDSSYIDILRLTGSTLSSIEQYVPNDSYMVTSYTDKSGRTYTPSEVNSKYPIIDLYFESL